MAEDKTNVTEEPKTTEVNEGDSNSKLDETLSKILESNKLLQERLDKIENSKKTVKTEVNKENTIDKDSIKKEIFIDSIDNDFKEFLKENDFNIEEDSYSTLRKVFKLYNKTKNTKSDDKKDDDKKEKKEDKKQINPNNKKEVVDSSKQVRSLFYSNGGK